MSQPTVRRPVQLTFLMQILTVLLSLNAVSAKGLAQTSTSSLNQVLVQYQGEGNNAYLIATTAPDNASGVDHLHIVATFNCNDYSYCNSTIDATFGNRGGFMGTYTAKGANPTGLDVHLQAYRQSDTTTNIYIVLANTWDVATYSVLENVEDNVFPSPINEGSATLPGTLVFDTASPAYPPATWAQFNGNLAVAGSFVYVGPGGGYFYSDSVNTVLGSSPNGNIFFAPTGVDGTNVATSTGTLTIGGPGEPNATLKFPDGTIQSTAFNPGNIGTSSFTGTLATQGNLVAGASSALPSTMQGAVTIANPAADGQGTATHGLLFVDDVFGAASAWTHAAIYSVGSTGYNGSLVFATDGDNASDFGVSEKMRISPNGYVGIGTETPGSSLEVNGNIKLTSGSGASVTYQDKTVQTTAWNGVLQGGDYAESVDVTGNRAEYEPGDVLVVDPNAEGRFAKSSEPYSTAVMGIYSTRPGVVGRRQKSERSHMAEEVPMAMIGVVPTKVTDEGGPIKPGDLLVTSSKPGYAMKGTNKSQMMGAIIGKALGHLDSGTGLIEVAVSLQ